MTIKYLQEFPTGLPVATVIDGIPAADVPSHETDPAFTAWLLATPPLYPSHLDDFTHADIAHTNRSALDLVSGTNTGDQPHSLKLAAGVNEIVYQLPTFGVGIKTPNLQSPAPGIYNSSFSLADCIICDTSTADAIHFKTASKLLIHNGVVKFDWVNMKFPSLTTNGFLKTGSSDGTLSVDTNTYLTSAEPPLGNPDVDGKVLSSTALGVRSWIEMLTVDTQENILASTPTANAIALASDSLKEYKFDGTDWYEGSSYFGKRTGEIAGALGGNVNDVGEDYITNKHLSYISLGSYDDDLRNPRNSSLRAKYADDTEKLEIDHYDEDFGWERLLKGIKLQNLDADLVTNDFQEQISILSGNSTSYDPNNIPLVQKGKGGTGAYRVPRKLIGRTLNLNNFYTEGDDVVSFAVKESTDANRHSFATTSQLYDGEFLHTDSGRVYIYNNGLVGLSLNTAVCNNGETVVHEGEITWN